MKKRLAQLLKDIGDSSIVIIGDLMLDEYIIGDSNRISPEAPEPVIEEQERSHVPGGAANVAVNATVLNADARLTGILGNDTEGEIFLTRLADLGVGTDGIIAADDRPTSRKTRLIARGNQVLRVDRETIKAVDGALEDRLVEMVNQQSGDVVVVSDYAKGVITPKLFKRILASGKRLIVDPKSSDFSIYSGAFLVTPNLKELCEACGASSIPLNEVEQETRKLMQNCSIENILVTLGADGMMLVEGNGSSTHIHTRAREVYDVTGAGDTVIATIACAVAAKASLEDACMIANIAAGIVVGKHMTATATPAEILDYAFGPSASEKIVDRPTLVSRVNELRKSGRRVVFTNGCFDLLHMGHITYLNESRAFGDALVVGLNTDSSIKTLKGDSRPIIPETERSHVLAALECVDYVILFDEETPYDLIKAVKPDILVKGADYTREQVVGYDVVEANGGEVRLVKLVGNMSTSDIIDRIKNG